MIIYTLNDPGTNDIRYVGCTIQPLWKRLSAHISEANSEIRKSETHKSKWIRKLIQQKLRPTIKILEITDAGKEREIYWISKLNEQGVTLVNGTPGGDGLPEGFKHSQKTKLKMSKSKKGIKPAWMNSDESIKIRKKITKKLTGRHLSNEHKQSISEGLIGKTKGRTYPEGHYYKKYKAVIQYDLSKNFIKQWESLKLIEDTLGFSKSAISRCCNKENSRTSYGFIWEFSNKN